MAECYLYLNHCSCGLWDALPTLWFSSCLSLHCLFPLSLEHPKPTFLGFLSSLPHPPALVVSGMLVTACACFVLMAAIVHHRLP